MIYINKTILLKTQCLWSLVIMFSCARAEKIDMPNTEIVNEKEPRLSPSPLNTRSTSVPRDPKYTRILNLFGASQDSFGNVNLKVSHKSSVISDHTFPLSSTDRTMEIPGGLDGSLKLKHGTKKTRKKRESRITNLKNYVYSELSKQNDTSSEISLDRHIEDTETTTKATATTTEYYIDSTPSASNVILCDHLPQKFSPLFHGHSSEICKSSKLKLIEYIDVLDVCRIIYGTVSGYGDPFYYGSFNYSGTMLAVYSYNKFVRVCLPFYRTLEVCEEREFLTICWERRVVFFHSSKCILSVNDFYLPAFLLDNNTECFEKFCDGTLTIFDSEVNGVKYRLTNALIESNNLSCGYLTENLNHLIDNYDETLYFISNVHWPCCYASYLVIWVGHPESHGLNGAWSYLPVSCQIYEVLLIVLVACIGVSGVAGNLCVVVVLLGGEHRNQESTLLRASLAFADLLTSLFVVVPSFFYHISPFLYPTRYEGEGKGIVLNPSQVDPSNTPIFNDRWTFHNEGFLLFQSIVFSITSTVSLLMLTILSVERSVITGRPLKYNEYFLPWKIKLAIVVSWITSTIYALMFALHHKGHLSSQMYTYSKLPTGSSGERPNAFLYILIYQGQIAILLIAGLSITIFSLLAIKNFVQEQARVAMEYRALNMRTSFHYKKENRQVLFAMILMLLLFLTATVPLTVNIIFQSLDYFYYHHNLFSYLAWWSFMAGTAWNPWLYTVRGKQYRGDAQILIKNIVAKILHQKNIREQIHKSSLETNPKETISRSKSE